MDESIKRLMEGPCSKYLFPHKDEVKVEERPVIGIMEEPDELEGEFEVRDEEEVFDGEDELPFDEGEDFVEDEEEDLDAGDLEW